MPRPTLIWGGGHVSGVWPVSEVVCLWQLFFRLGWWYGDRGRLHTLVIHQYQLTPLRLTLVALHATHNYHRFITRNKKKQPKSHAQIKKINYYCSKIKHYGSKTRARFRKLMQSMVHTIVKIHWIPHNLIYMVNPQWPWPFTSKWQMQYQHLYAFDVNNYD
jgi:hypothetical protein